MNETTKPEATTTVAGRFKPIVIFRPKRGQLQLKWDRNSILFFWPKPVIVNVAVGFMAKTGFMLKTYNKWSEEKYKSASILLLGFGIGFCRDYEEI